MKKIVLLFIWICSLTNNGCFGDIKSNISAEGALTASNNDLKAIVAGNTDFALALYDRLKNDPNATVLRGNLLFSPYSISTSLAMTYGGACGQTQKQMAATLHFTLPNEQFYPVFGSLQKQLVQKDKSTGYQLLLANALWKQKGVPFLKAFLDLNQSNYEARLDQLDFLNETEQSRQTINHWVEGKTDAKIKDLIPSDGVNCDTAMVLANAVYFKGDWETKFDKSQTEDTNFFVSVGNSVKVPMMHLKHNFNYYVDEQLQIIEIPYKGDEISMLIFLPKEIGKFKEIENILIAKTLNTLQGKMETMKIDIYLPKYRIICGTYRLNKPLIALGMSDAFDRQIADFSGISDKEKLWISDVFHKAYIEVNEEGTEAAAATGTAIAHAGNTSIVFRADHPFVFIIRDNRSGSILFMGRLMNPATEE